MRRAQATTVTVTNANTDEADQTAESGQSYRSSDRSDILTIIIPQNEITAHWNARYTRMDCVNITRGIPI